jgi:hypothetical protein
MGAGFGFGTKSASATPQVRAFVLGFKLPWRGNMLKKSHFIHRAAKQTLRHVFSSRETRPNLMQSGGARFLIFEHSEKFAHSVATSQKRGAGW